ncbi:MAG: hypothetical protein E7514_04965 [Ruminococcaceae bacterium]|nr:hypothetical protein [Oscillospiraceae bacterium]
MISFSVLSPLMRSVFALWALLLCLSCIGSGMLAVVKKRFSFTAFAFILFVPSYLLWQIIFDFSLHVKIGAAAPITETVCGLSRVYWLCAFLLLSVLSVILLMSNLKYDKTFITPGAIKVYLDKMPCGVCCWRENGRVLFSNICMNTLCAAITKNALLNGNQFRDAVRDGIKNVDGKVWRFVSREINVDDEMLYEMIASDITAEYAKTEALEKDKAELSRLNKELREYYSSIDESVKRQEILQAKMNIHDEMNRLMLSTVAADKNDAAALDNIFSLWEHNALLLCMETDSRANIRQTGALDSLAKALGIKVLWKSDLPDILDGSQKELFFFTAQEALINAVKHAGAKNLEISFEKTEGSLICRFTNDGKLPDGDVCFEGGLANIRLLARKQNADICTELGPRFTLVLKYQPIG